MKTGLLATKLVEVAASLRLTLFQAVSARARIMYGLASDGEAEREADRPVRRTDRKTTDR
jgi:hypothetical protein